MSLFNNAFNSWYYNITSDYMGNLAAEIGIANHWWFFFPPVDTVQPNYWELATFKHDWHLLLLPSKMFSRSPVRSMFPVLLKRAILPVISQQNMQRFPNCWFRAGLALLATICANSCIGAIFGSGPGALSVRHFFVQYCMKGTAVCYKKLIVVADVSVSASFVTLYLMHRCCWVLFIPQKLGYFECNWFALWII